MTHFLWVAFINYLFIFDRLSRVCQVFTNLNHLIMRILNFILMAAIIVAISACEKTELIKENQPTVNVEPIGVQHGMLVFDKQETFDATLKMLDNMTSKERIAWEENLGFKSYDRLIREIVDAQIALHSQYEKLPEEEQQVLLESGNYEEFAPITKNYIKKGIVKIEKDENNEEHLNFAEPLFSKLINPEGFVVVGNYIFQYTEDFYKVIKDRDFSKINDLTKINLPKDNEEFYIIELKNKTRKSTYYPININVSSNTVNREKIVLFEKLEIISPDIYGYKLATYTIRARAEQRQWNGKFRDDYTRIWLDGTCHVVDYYGDSYWPLDVDDVHDYQVFRTVYKRSLPYPGSDPTIPTSVWTASRWGGPHGITVRLTDHWEVWRDN